MRSIWVRSIVVLVSVAVVAVMPWPAAADAQDRPANQPVSFGGDYDSLSDVQRTLVDDLFKRAGTILGTTVDPREVYNSAALSVRTTFEAVTHALSRSVLTDRQSGESLGRALDLIEYVEKVEGQVKGASGDQQFRLWVALEPNARDVLARAREFRRTADNTVFHKGYPVSFRQDDYPSVQFSMTEDGTRADIDVDYRSSSFPAALVNGHLTAANSDVRAGNFERHNGRWSGLVNWLEGFVAALFTARVDVPDDAARIFPPVPRAGGKTIDVAVDDFLTSWLVEGQPNLAVAYADDDVFDCLALRLEGQGQTLDRGLARLQLYVRMKMINDVLGPRSGLEGTTRGVRLTDPAIKLVIHDHPALYSIYAVPDSMAAQLSCSSYTQFGTLPSAVGARVSREAYEHFYTTFVVTGPNGSSVALGMLWERRNGQWKIVSYQLAEESAAGSAVMPDLRKAAASVEIPRMQADPALVTANERFLEDWLVRKRYDEAFSTIAPECYACVNLYLDPDEAPKSTRGEQQARLRTGMERMGERIGRVARLEDVIRGVEPSDPRLGVVEHRRSQAFSLWALPDWAGRAAECEERLAHGDQVLTAEGDGRAYGRYYATALQFVPRAGETAVLFLAWAREDGRWRITAYKIITP